MHCTNSTPEAVTRPPDGFDIAGLCGIFLDFFPKSVDVYCHSLCAQYIRAEGKTVLFAVQGMMNTALVIGFNLILLLAVNMGVTGYVLSVVLADSACAVYLFFKERLWRLVIPKPDKNIFRQMLRYSIPLIPTTVFWWITSVSDRYKDELCQSWCEFVLFDA